MAAVRFAQTDSLNIDPVKNVWHCMKDAARRFR
jgi:hypothetical protein